MLYKGSCHCGNVAFEVEAEIGAAVACNCSICARKGALLAAVLRESLRLLTPEDRIGTYTFGKGAMAHRFCTACGIHPFAEDAGAQEQRTAYVNVRCLEGLELAAVQVVEFDGRSM